MQYKATAQDEKDGWFSVRLNGFVVEVYLTMRRAEKAALRLERALKLIQEAKTPGTQEMGIALGQ